MPVRHSYYRYLWSAAFALLPVLAAGAGEVPGVASALLAVFVLAFFCEFLDSALGMGFGTILAPLLIWLGYEPRLIVPAILFSELVTGFAAGFFHWRDGNLVLNRGSPHRQALLILAATSLAGALIGVPLALSVPRGALNASVGLVSIASGLALLLTLRRKLAYRAGKLAAVGLVAAVSKGMSGGGYGPLLTAGQLLAGINGKAAAGITSLTEGLTCLAGLLLFASLSEQRDLTLLLWLTAGALAATPFASAFARLRSQRAMQGLVGALAAALGLITLSRSIF